MGKPCYEYHQDLPGVYADAWKESLPAGRNVTSNDMKEKKLALHRSVENHKKQGASRHLKVCYLLST